MLSADAIEQAHSGHPGLPLGCAELGALLYGEILKHYPGDPSWPDRDRFVLSAGHGSMLLYALLHLAGYDLTLEDLRRFRQLGSRTPGHPERGLTPGVETTSGPLGQGFANAVGMAIAERMLAARFNTEKHRLVDHHTYVLASDGDLMEGVVYEAASLAGHLGLGKLLVFYDSNGITIDGGTELSFGEEVPARFRACGWQTLEGDAYDLEGILERVAQAKAKPEKPSLILLHSTIGCGAPGLAGSHQAHGGALGPAEVQAMKQSLGVSGEFYVSPEAVAYFSVKRKAWERDYRRWQERFEAWKGENPGLYREWRRLAGGESGAGQAAGRLPNPIQGAPDPVALPEFQVGEKVATRIAGGKVLTSLRQQRPELVGGSADLTVPCFGSLPGLEAFSRANPGGWWIHYGVREHAMGAVSNGLALHGPFRPFCATFMAFSDYMRPAIRLAAMMRLPVIFVMTHDSVRIGEDGPTHQPVEHLAALRAIPGLAVLRPADAQETVEAWRVALERVDGPTVIALTRFELEVFAKGEPLWREGFRRGAYIVRESEGEPELVIIATGSEVPEALEACREAGSRRVRVLSMPWRERFLAQEREYREKLLPRSTPRIVIEAGVAQGWQAVFTEDNTILSIERFGVSAPGPQAAAHLQVDAQALRQAMEQALQATRHHAAGSPA
jgi:transketolase